MTGPRGCRKTLNRSRSGERAGDHVEVHDGVAPGDEVALKGAGFLEDGDRVTVAREPEGHDPPLAKTESRQK